MAATIEGTLLSGDHASRPAAGTPPVGAVYMCSDHDKMYQTDGSSWSDYIDISALAGAFMADGSVDLTGSLTVDVSGTYTFGTNVLRTGKLYPSGMDLGSENVVGSSFGVSYVAESGLATDPMVLWSAPASTTYGPAIWFVSAEGTPTVPTGAVDNDYAGAIIFGGLDSVGAPQKGAVLWGEVDGTPGDDVFPTKVGLSTRNATDTDNVTRWWWTIDGDFIPDQDSDVSIGSDTLRVLKVWTDAVDTGALTVDGVDINPTGGSEGDVLTQQADGSLAPETPSGGGSLDELTDVNLTSSAPEVGDLLGYTTTYSVGSANTESPTVSCYLLEAGTCGSNARYDIGGDCTYDFGVGNPQRLSKAVIRFYSVSGQHATAIAIECSDDDVTYTVVKSYSVTTYDTDMSIEFDDITQSARYWRIRLVSGEGEGWFWLKDWYDTDSADEWVPETPGWLATGTSFPASPTSGDRYRRSDLDHRTYRYDGTRWVSDEEFVASVLVEALSADATKMVPVLPLDDCDVYVERVAATVDVDTTNDGSNYWSVTAQKDAGSTGWSAVGSGVDTSGESADERRFLEDDVDTAVTFATGEAFGIAFAKTGSPGNLDAVASIVYRLIAP